MIMLALEFAALFVLAMLAIGAVHKTWYDR